jgi:hypothetical protein
MTEDEDELENDYDFGNEADYWLSSNFIVVETID